MYDESLINRDLQPKKALLRDDDWVMYRIFRVLQAMRRAPLNEGRIAAEFEQAMRRGFARKVLAVAAAMAVIEGMIAYDVWRLLVKCGF